MSVNVTKGHLGYMEMGIQPATASTPPTSVISVPFMSISPMNPSNDSYIPSVNKSVGPSIVVRGIYTPGLTIRAVPLEGWFTAATLNSMFVTDIADATNNYDTAQYMAHIVEPGGAEMKIAGIRWGALSLTHAAAGNMLGCEFGGICTSMDDSGTTWAGSGSIVPGQAFGPSQVDYGASATATKVRGWQLNLIRAQAYDIFSGGPAGATASRAPSGTSTGQIGGTLTLEFSPTTANTIPSTTVTIRILKSGGTAHVTIACDLNLDAPVRSYTTGFGTQVNTYTLIDYANGGSPVTFS